MRIIKELHNCTTLFLDRDGVINKLRPNDYVKTWDEFEFLPEVQKFCPELKRHFKRIVVVTNQRGVGRGIMTEEVLNHIHDKMKSKLSNFGCDIDKIYYCTAVNDNDENRKPNIGMALQAKGDFPEIDFNTSVMIGDSKSDKLFATNAGIGFFYFDIHSIFNL